MTTDTAKHSICSWTCLVLALSLVALACGAIEQESAPPGLDDSKVPQEFRHLLPLAERWGIGDDIDRFEAVERATPEERAELDAATREYGTRINDWLNTFDSGAMSEEAAAFMYMLSASDEMGHEWPSR